MILFPMIRLEDHALRKERESSDVKRLKVNKLFWCSRNKFKTKDTCSKTAAVLKINELTHSANHKSQITNHKSQSTAA